MSDFRRFPFTPARTDPAPRVTAALGYLPPDAERPVSYACEPPPGTPWESCGYAWHTMPIADARQTPHKPSVDREGYTLCHAPTAVTNFFDEEAIRQTYYAEAAALALAVTGARQAHVFDHLVRRREADRRTLSFGKRGVNGRAATNGRIHNDYTEASGLKRLALVLPDPALAARVGRYGIVNVWRSISGPVRDTPLAVCDARTVSTLDLVAGEVRYPRRTGEIYLARHAPRHRWAYFPQMDRDEALVFKQYDSQVSGVARLTLHAAFDLPDIPPDTPLRESIELRCLVVYDQS
jgi:hypothetical protein